MKLWQWIFWIIVFAAGCNSGRSETLNQLRNRVDTKLTNMVPILVARQNAYFTNHNHYWQGLITFTALPSHTASTVADSLADRLAFHPTDQSESWSDLFPEFNIETFAAGAIVTVYDGPTGVDKGWILRVIVKYNGVIYERQKVFGSLTTLDFNWRVLNLED